MNVSVIIAMLIFFIIAVVLFTKLYLIKKSAKEITEQLCDILSADTNTLITISSRDKHIRRLASELNTELKLLREERRRCHQGDIELKEAITNISHDLRTPLTAINGCLDLLEREEKSTAAEEYLARIRNRTNAMTLLTEELFRYSIAAAEQELKAEKTDVVRILEECLLSYYGAMCEKGITPEISLPDAPVYIELDPDAASRIFSNMISNALKYSSGDLSVKMSADGTIIFSNSAPKLDAVTVGRLFDRFYTIEAGRGSTGLGLSIARLLTERMGGKITASYIDGKLIMEICLYYCSTN